MFRTLLVAGLCVVSVSAFAQKYDATLSGAQQVPPVTSTGTGTATMTLDGDKLTYDVEYKDLSGPATAAHIHGPAAAGANAGVMIPFANPASPIKGTVNSDAGAGRRPEGGQGIRQHPHRPEQGRRDPRPDQAGVVIRS